jgi:hypothetical protein
VRGTKAVSVAWLRSHWPWTPAFNEMFRKKYGISPVPLYPALWQDIGPDTAAVAVAA